MLALQLLLNVLALGAAYALVALGFVLILNATGAVNFAQGDLVMVGGFIGVVLASYLPVPPIVLLPLLLSNAFFVTPTDGANYILKAYIAIVIGGWGSIPGAVAGALLIALFEVVYPSLPLLIPMAGADPSLFSQTTSTIVLDLAILLI